MDSLICLLYLFKRIRNPSYRKEILFYAVEKFSFIFHVNWHRSFSSRQSSPHAQEQDRADFGIHTITMVWPFVSCGLQCVFQRMCVLAPWCALGCASFSLVFQGCIFQMTYILKIPKRRYLSGYKSKSMKYFM